MIELFVPALVIHVIVAILGLGSLLSIALVSGAARRTGRDSMDLSPWLVPLFRVSGVTLAAMLATGALMDFATGGAFHDWWWFRASVLLVAVTGVLLGLARRSLRRGLMDGEGRDVALRRIERMAYSMCALVAAITALMEAKPF